MAFTGTAAAGLATSGVASAGASSLAKGVLLWIGVGSVGGGALAFVASELTRPEPAVVDAARPARVAPAPKPRPASAAAVPAPELAPSEPDVVPAPSAAVSKLPAHASAAPSESALGSNLFDELRVIEAARAAVGRGDAAAALVALNRYDRSYPSGQFAPEALALRVEALAASGATEQARALAGEFARRYPRNPLRSRVSASVSR
jgi:TolA-binding protein